MTTLKIQHCPQYSDAAFADMVRMMPQLQTVNLKGCTLVGEQTVKAVIKLEGLRSVNLKGTRVTEGDVRELLGKKGGGLVVFKVDNVVFKDVSWTSLDGDVARRAYVVREGGLGPKVLGSKWQHFSALQMEPRSRVCLGLDTGHPFGVQCC